MSGGTLPIYNAIDPSATAPQTAAIDALLAQNGDMIDFLDDRFGPYPFDSYGAIFDRAPGVGYALEVQTKSHFASLGSSNGTYLHELAHQWFGNSVTLARWSDIWFNEGWAQFAEWVFEFDNGDSPLSPAAAVRRRLRRRLGLGLGDRAGGPRRRSGEHVLFFPTYLRGAMTVEGYREIVGDTASSTSPSRCRPISPTTTFRPTNSSDSRRRHPVFTGADLARLEQYFQQWLYGTVKPTLTPADF